MLYLYIFALLDFEKIEGGGRGAESVKFDFKVHKEKKKKQN